MIISLEREIHDLKEYHELMLQKGVQEDILLDVEQDIQLTEIKMQLLEREI